MPRSVYVCIFFIYILLLHVDIEMYTPLCTIMVTWGQRRCRTVRQKELRAEVNGRGCKFVPITSLPKKRILSFQRRTHSVSVQLCVYVCFAGVIVRVCESTKRS